MSRVDAGFWHGRRVLLTGHTGFKGSWAALWLAVMGARVTGLSLAPEAGPNLFLLAEVETGLRSRICDLRDEAGLRSVVRDADPEIVLHMAAQPLVRQALKEPLPTIATNVLGTANLLDALRTSPDLRAVLVVTTDKVYENAERGVAFAEGDPLGGRDPYAASKAACEVVTSAMARSYFEPRGVAIATARGGNVIGGGDFAADRLIPDSVRAVKAGLPLALRYPLSIRPWQHVLDCLGGYLLYLEALADKEQAETMPRSLNIGPAAAGLTVSEVAKTMLEALGSSSAWVQEPGDHPHEARLLTLDTSLARRMLDWSDRLPGRAALEATASWYRDWAGGMDMRARTLREIEAYMAI